MKMRPLLLILIMLLCVSCSRKPSSHADLPGVIFTTAQAQNLHLAFSDSAWTPSEEQVNQMEVALPQYLATFHFPGADTILTNLARYKRQYFGVTENGQRLIFLNAFSDEFARTHESWKTEYILVMDGGPAFVKAYYNPESKVFVRLMVNSVA